MRSDVADCSDCSHCLVPNDEIITLSLYDRLFWFHVMHVFFHITICRTVVYYVIVDKVVLRVDPVVKVLVRIHGVSDRSGGRVVPSFL